jgi:RHS repeat-associated protein
MRECMVCDSSGRRLVEGYILENRSDNPGNSKYKFTGKERDKDIENNYDYFGARYYDSRIGRWGGMEPLLDKYVGWSPYNYGLCKPVNLLDANGLDLTLGGNVQKAFDDLQSILTADVQSRLTVDENNVVHFDASGLDLANDAASELINNMVTSENNYLFEVTNMAEGVQRETSPKYDAGQTVPYNFSPGGEDVALGLVNLSVTSENIGMNEGRPGNLPKSGYQGQVSLGLGDWTKPGSRTEVQPRSNIVFHELAENYNRTEKKLTKGQAHASAVDYAGKYKKQRGEPGRVGRYLPCGE